MATCGGCGWRGHGARRPYRESDVAYVALPPRAVVLRRSSDALFFPAASRHASVLVAPHARAVDGHVSVLDSGYAPAWCAFGSGRESSASASWRAGLHFIFNEKDVFE